MTYSLKLIDMEVDEACGVFGTCEICMSSGTYKYEVFTFEVTEDEEKFIINAENGSSGYSGCETFLRADNSADLAHWISQKKSEGKAPRNEEEMQHVLSDLDTTYSRWRNSQLYLEDGYEANSISVIATIFAKDPPFKFYDDRAMPKPLDEALLGAGFETFPYKESLSTSSTGFLDKTNTRVTSFGCVSRKMDIADDVFKYAFDAFKSIISNDPQCARSDVEFDVSMYIEFVVADNKFYIETSEEDFKSHKGNGDYPQCVVEKMPA